MASRQLLLNTSYSEGHLAIQFCVLQSTPLGIVCVVCMYIPVCTCTYECTACTV